MEKTYWVQVEGVPDDAAHDGCSRLTTLWLIRAAVGPFSISGMAPGTWCDASDKIVSIS